VYKPHPLANLQIMPESWSGLSLRLQFAHRIDLINPEDCAIAKDPSRHRVILDILAAGWVSPCKDLMSPNGSHPGSSQRWQTHVIGNLFSRICWRADSAGFRSGGADSPAKINRHRHCDQGKYP
jgi:hypothetical protein